MRVATGAALIQLGAVHPVLPVAGQARQLLARVVVVAQGAVILVLLVVDVLHDDTPAQHAGVADGAAGAVPVYRETARYVLAGPAGAAPAIIRKERQQIVDANLRGVAGD